MADLQEENCSWSESSKYLFYLLHMEVTIINTNITNVSIWFEDKCYNILAWINIKRIKYFWKLFSNNLNGFWQKKGLYRLKDDESILDIKLGARIQSDFPNAFERGKFNSDSVCTRRSCLLEVVR